MFFFDVDEGTFALPFQLPQEGAGDFAPGPHSKLSGKLWRSLHLSNGSRKSAWWGRKCMGPVWSLWVCFSDLLQQKRGMRLASLYSFTPDAQKKKKNDQRSRSHCEDNEPSKVLRASQQTCLRPKPLIFVSFSTDSLSSLPDSSDPVTTLPLPCAGCVGLE
jgi:hypothetical protein